MIERLVAGIIGGALLAAMASMFTIVTLAGSDGGRAIGQGVWIGAWVVGLVVAGGLAAIRTTRIPGPHWG